MGAGSKEILFLTMNVFGGGNILLIKIRLRQLVTITSNRRVITNGIFRNRVFHMDSVHFSTFSRRTTFYFII